MKINPISTPLTFSSKLLQRIGFTVIVLLGLFTILATGGNGDDPPKPGVLQLSVTAFSVSESSADLLISVTRTSGDDGSVSVDFATEDGTAVAASDYTANSGTLSWGDSDSVTKTFSIAITDDTAVELTESFSVVLSNVSGATLGAGSSAVVTVNDNDSISIIGTVKAPNGVIAITEPNLMERLTDRLLTLLWGKPVTAAIADLVSPVPSATVSVFEVNANGDLVNPNPITTSTTDGNGSYALAAPLDAPAVKYIVRALGGAGHLDSRIHSSTVDVDPVSDAASRLITDVTADLSVISNNEVVLIHELVAERLPDIQSAGATTLQLTDRLVQESNNHIGTNNQISSMAAAGTICGNISNSGAAPLSNIKIKVRDYLDRTMRAQTYSQNDGNYCVNVPFGSYIVGAVNTSDDSNDPSRSASEWYSAGGVAYNPIDAEVVNVNSSTTVSGINLQLENGARIAGTVTAADTNAALEGVQIRIRDFDNRYVVAVGRSETNGQFSFNVIAGRYLLEAQNQTIKAYASETYAGIDGSNNRNIGIPVTLATGDEISIDFTLEPGYLLSGNVSENGTPQTNTRVVIDINGSAANRIRTNNLGDYSLWLLPDIYDVYAYGQQNPATDLSTSGQVVNFNTAVTRINGSLRNATGTVTPRYVEIRIMDAVGTLIDSEISWANGSFTAHSNQTGDHLILFRILHTSDIAGTVYNGHTRLLSGDPVTITSVGSHQSLGTINLPDGVTLNGHVYAESSDSVSLSGIANFRVQLRDDDDLSTTGTGNTLDDRFQQTRTRGDGSYRITVPATAAVGTYDRIKMRDATLNGNCDGITLSPLLSNILNYYNGDNVCELNP
ncbi:MAG: hypothetical protein OEZ68_20300 [Gammaproteobacteria bacterium]|nr:hypothetical protein [Gammaproteobacteria bacterium]MDH5803146.1 hypothetical protein [Gammaproteobacteria bacterium]